MKKLLIILGIVSLSFNSQAKTANGFIVTTNLDTIFGEIKLHKFERATGAFLLNGFDLNWCFFSVSFKGRNDKRFKNYKPFELHCYQFTYKSVIYAFKSFEVYFTRLINQKDQIPRFLQRIFEGEICLYRDIIYAPQMTETAKFYAYYEYYLFKQGTGLIKVEQSNNIATVKDLLQQFEVEQGFIDELSQGIRFKDIGLILEQYQRWLSSK